ncbi:MAG: DUF4157 domain-containing protein, partial [Blastocatellia bacterium]
MSHPSDELEREADLIAQQVMSSLGSRTNGNSRGSHSPIHASSAGKTASARATIHREASPSSQSAVSASTSAAKQSQSEQAPAGIAGLIVEDDARQLAPGQMRKTQFLDALQTAVCTAADAELAAAGRSTKGCPYIEKWLGHYRSKDSRHVERALQKFAPEAAGAKSATDYLPIVSNRIRKSVSVWAKTGQLTGVPEELAGEMSGGGVLGALSGLASGISSAFSGLAAGIGSAVSNIAGGIGKAVSSVGSLLFKARDGGAVDAHPDHIHSHLGAGQPLDSGVKQRMESAFGHSFSHVRVHNDTSAGQLSESLNAKAFTLGEHVAFGAGEYQPGTIVGDALIAHELAHVIQQGHGPATAAAKSTYDDGADTLEEDADRSAIGAVASIWAGRDGELSGIAASSKPRLGSGLRLQRCGPKRSDLQINGVSDDPDPKSVFFDRASSTLDSSQDPKITPLASPPGSDLTLHGFTSEDEQPSLAGSRIGTVAGALTAKGHTGPQVPSPEPAAGVGKIDYRSMRKVIVVPTGAPTGQTNCAAGSVVPCSPASQFTDAQTRARDLLDPTITALSGALTPDTLTKLDARFGSSAAN